MNRRGLTHGDQIDYAIAAGTLSSQEPSQVFPLSQMYPNSGGKTITTIAAHAA